jgi:UDP-N-acetylmuramyl pentapeptide phosphotransferase/UDP-N-acetylglucosamine-1-phosphate transferase
LTLGNAALNVPLLSSLLIGFALAALLSYVGVALLRHWTLRRKVLDLPNDRSLHQQPTPRGGGLMITLTVLLGWLPFALMFGAPRVTSAHAAFLGCGFLVAGISGLDDLRGGVSTRIRLAVHLVAALVAVIVIGGWTSIRLPWLGEFQLGVAGLIVAVIWIVGFTNAFNFMDGIDGIAGGQALVSGAGWALIGIQAHQPNVFTLGLLIAAGAFGFLLHNWPPARIFMGDVGSAFLGFALAALPLWAISDSSPGGPGQTVDYDPLTSGMLVWPFVCDAAFTFVRRLRNGENVFAAHRSHLYQRLVLAGWSHRSVTMLYLCLAITGVVMAVAWRSGIDVAALGVPILFLFLVSFVNRQEKARVAMLAPVSTERLL